MVGAMQTQNRAYAKAKNAVNNFWNISMKKISFFSSLWLEMKVGFHHFEPVEKGQKMEY